jgi:hypothetical protein
VSAFDKFKADLKVLLDEAEFAARARRKAIEAQHASIAARHAAAICNAEAATAADSLANARAAVESRYLEALAASPTIAPMIAEVTDRIAAAFGCDAADAPTVGVWRRGAVSVDRWPDGGVTIDSRGRRLVVAQADVADLIAALDASGCRPDGAT